MMSLLPGFVACLLLVAVQASGPAEDHSTTSTSSPATDANVHLDQCPGLCEPSDSCVTILNETDCSDGRVCCVDHLQKASTTEFSDWDTTTAAPRDISDTTSVDWSETTGEPILTTLGEVVEESEDAETTPTDDGNEETGQEYTYVYSDGSEYPSEMELLSQGRSGEFEECPGECVQDENVIERCQLMMQSNDMCPSGTTCCVDENQVVGNENEGYTIAVEEQNEEKDDHDMSRRSLDSKSDNCPGICVHPSHAVYCDQILPEFPCPLNAKCCIKGVAERAIYGPQITECTGQCLPPNMRGYCFPPNDIFLGPTNCAQGTTCCMMRPRQDFLQPPSVNRMKFPSLPSRGSHTNRNAQVLGHLAVDEAGTIFKVNTNGQISPLPKLSPMDHQRSTFTKLTSYPRFDGEIAIYSDSQGILYQQFYPREPFILPKPQQPNAAATVRQPVYQYQSQGSVNSAKFPPTEAESSPDEVLEDIVIPDDDDEAPKPTKSSVAASTDSSMPVCPGSCMSYFLRFTCFRGYAIYDGFSCPGRSVCCAKLKDIEDHEQYLKSLSPYFNTPAPARGSNPHRCGIKGRRDTPRVIGGKESLPGEWCWQVAVINAQNQYICGGALIDDSWVLTAAHCVAGIVKENQALYVRVGVTDLKSSDDNSKAQTVRVLSTFIHHNFNNMNLDNNIALLRLKKPVDFSSNVCVICLPTTGHMPRDETKCTVTGYGFVSADGDMSLKIREGQVPIINDMDCMANVSEAMTNPFILPASSFCAGGQGQQDACQGDAGGPLACEIGGYHELVGLVSWGLGCGRNDVPSIYVKVPAFMGWINQIISSNSFLRSLD